MDESLQELENELKALRPRRPSAEWTQRINRDLAAELPASARPRYTSSTNLSSWKWLGWRTAGLAAALALGALALVRLNRPASPAVVAVNPPAPAAVPDYQPVAATNVLYELKDEGPVKTDDGTTARQVRARYVDTYTWKNTRGNASLKWSVPREEVRVLPASFNPN